MRTNPKFSRVRSMILAPEVPRLDNGGVALCHGCQRSAYFAGGFLLLMAKDLSREADLIHLSGSKPRCPRCGDERAYRITTRKKLKCVGCGKQYSEKSITPDRCSKLPDQKKAELLKAFKTMSVHSAAQKCGVQYRTAWRLSKLADDLTA